MRATTSTLSALLAGLLLSACDLDVPSRIRALSPAKASPSTADSKEKRVAAEMPTPTGVLLAGQSEEEVLKIAGTPSGRVTSGKRTVLTYCGETLVFDDGRLCTPDPNFFAKVKANRIAATERAELEKQQALQRESEARRRPPAPPKKTLAAAPKKAPAAAPAPAKPKHRYVDLLTPGSISVVDFYADWCGPCRYLAPILSEIERKNPDAVFTRINIQDWGSEVVRKYGITAVPTVMVFDANGNIVGPPTSNPTQIANSIERARKSR